MRAKVVKALRKHAGKDAGEDNQATEYQTEVVKESYVEKWDGKQFVKIPWVSYKVSMKRTCARAYYQWLKREFRANKLQGVA